MAEAQISRLQREILRTYPRGKRQPARLLALWEATMAAWESIPARTRSLAGTDLSASDKSSIRRDRKRWAERMRTYHDALKAAKPDDEAGVYRTVVRGFLLNYPGSGHHVPDCLFPQSFLNMVKAGEDAHREAWDGFVKDLRARVQKVIVEPAETVAKSALATVRLAPILLGVAGSVAAGLIVWRLTGPRR